jgi:CRISPR/Cas system CMR-associated protein Cmr1 (group 7 of RAMP superfamily)
LKIGRKLQSQKEIAMLERKKKKSGRQRDEEKEELPISKPKSIRKVSPLVTNLEKSSEKSAEALLVPEITSQENVKPDCHL